MSITTIHYNTERVVREGHPASKTQGNHIKGGVRYEDSSKRWRSVAESIRGLLLGFKTKISHDEEKGIIYTPLEMRIMLEEVLKKFNEFYPNNITKIVILEGWKGKGDFYLGRTFENDFIVEIWHNEQKEKKIVKKEHLNKMLRLIEGLEIGKVYSCYEISEKLGYEWKYLWANRMNLYFAEYYIPLKIFNEIGVIRYGGNKKTIERLK